MWLAATGQKTASKQLKWKEPERALVSNRASEPVSKGQTVEGGGGIVILQGRDELTSPPPAPAHLTSYDGQPL